MERCTQSVRLFIHSFLFRIRTDAFINKSTRFVRLKGHETEKISYEMDAVVHTIQKCFCKDTHNCHPDSPSSIFI
uniref:Uncharacterized protein n=1 Tax=Onchocerca volvulus TaxID=6282 RepID=A0A8R1TVE7_ONCVO